MVSLFKLNVRYPIFDQKIMIFWGIYDIRRKKVSSILRQSFVSRFEKNIFWKFFPFSLLELGYVAWKVGKLFMYRYSHMAHGGKFAV